MPRDGKGFSLTTLALPQIKGQDKLTNSRIQTFRTCNRRAYYAYEAGFRPDHDATALRIGGCVHKALEVFWGGGGHAAAMAVVHENYATLPAWCKSADDELRWFYEYGTVIELMDGYVRRWGDSTPKAVAVELEFDLPILNPETGAKSRTFNMAGKIDAIAHVPALNDRLAVVEHKTTGDDDIGPDSDYWRRLRLDSQISQYMHAARRMGHEVETVLYDVIRKPSIQPEQVALRDEDGFKIVLDKNGERVWNTKPNGDRVKPRETGSTEHGWVVQNRPQNADEWRAKLAADILARPDYYFQRQEIPRIDSDMEEFEQELWQTTEMIREAKTKNRWIRNSGACVSYSRCPYLDVCALGLDIGESPVGLRRVDNVNPELNGDAE